KMDIPAKTQVDHLKGQRQIYNHTDGNNILFVDGHAKFYSRKKSWYWTCQNAPSSPTGVPSVWRKLNQFSHLTATEGCGFWLPSAPPPY
ncbi:MAG TPA: hypothetical protein VNA16_02075, partial [Abditibacteriaceae bacterium]|nr:hypothetical protein [Abditibacteriaceae bacterium]